MASSSDEKKIAASNTNPNLNPNIELQCCKAKPPGGDKSLLKLIKQEVKKNTNLDSAPSPSKDSEKPQS